MRVILVLLIIMVGFSSCKSSKRAKTSKTSNSKTISTTKPSSTDNTSFTKSTYTLQDSITDYAKTFEGVKYKWGGTTTSGMDCSGLVFESFRAHQIYLPRISRDMAKKGSEIKLNDVKIGDLLFFTTSKNRRNTINHVGLVVEVTNTDIVFIHSTTRKGVITSLLSETYWNNTFTEARRYL